jgi:hypothetical protein
MCPPLPLVPAKAGTRLDSRLRGGERKIKPETELLDKV